MYSRLHEMCEFLHLNGADYRELPANGGVDDLHALWKLRRRPRAGASSAPVKRSAAEDRGRDLPSRSTSQARARLSPESSESPVSIDLKWAGGKVETK
jgi:hypothetical protein